MKKFAPLIFLALVAAQQPAEAPGAATDVAAVAPKLTPDEIIAERDRYVQEVRASTAGREKEPAEAVFKNIQRFKGVPAGRLLAIMNMGFGRSLGVSCTHCHSPGGWDKDDKPQKQIAREMGAMADKINKELLPAIKNLDSKQPVVNCTTCHRGEVKPALNLDPRK